MKILVIRLSAMGDVAMLLPVLYAVARANPEHEFTLLTQPFLANLLLSPPNNLEAMVIETRGEERGFWGLCRYVDRLRDEGFDLCLDLHDVLRTKVLRWGLCFTSVRTFVLDKQRERRRRLLRPEGSKRLDPLVPMWQAYLDVFARAGLRLDEPLRPIQMDARVYSLSLREAYPEAFDAEIPLVAVAPFASTPSKTYDLVQMQGVVAGLSAAGIGVYLFGARGEEASLLDAWAGCYEGVRSLAGRLELAEELALMSQANLMLAMDSANMHLASLVGTRVLSVWCGTHPAAGFLGVGQSLEDCLHDETLGCRPCSIFGKVRRCSRGDLPCRRSLSADYVVQRVLAVLDGLHPKRPM